MGIGKKGLLRLNCSSAGYCAGCCGVLRKKAPAVLIIHRLLCLMATRPTMAANEATDPRLLKLDEEIDKMYGIMSNIARFIVQISLDPSTAPHWVALSMDAWMYADGLRACHRPML